MAGSPFSKASNPAAWGHAACISIHLLQAACRRRAFFTGYLGAAGAGGNAGPRRPCAGQPAPMANSHLHYLKLASNFREVKCSLHRPSSFPWPASQGPRGFRWATSWENRLCRAQTPVAPQPTCQRWAELP
jgi:hypothetical protein